MADINKTYTSNTLYNDSTGVIAFAEQLKQELINWANYHHVTEELGPDNRPDTQNALNNLFLSVYERFLTFLNDADATEEAINTWKEIENFLADYTDEKTLAEIVAELNANIESRLTVPLESTTGSSTTSTMTQKAITETIDASSTFTTGEKVKNVGIDTEPTAGSDNLVKSGGVSRKFEDIISGIGSIKETPIYGDTSWTWGSYCDTSGALKPSTYWGRKAFLLKKNQLIEVETLGTGCTIIATSDNGTTFEPLVTNQNPNKYGYRVPSDGYYYVFVRQPEGESPVINIRAAEEPLVDGAVLDSGTLYNEKDSTNRVCVYYPIYDASARYAVRLKNVSLSDSSNGIYLAFRKHKGPFITSSAYNFRAVNSDSLNELYCPEEYQAQANYIAITQITDSGSCSFYAEVYKVDERIQLKTVFDDDVLFRPNINSFGCYINSNKNGIIVTINGFGITINRKNYLIADPQRESDTNILLSNYDNVLCIDKTVLLENNARTSPSLAFVEVTPPVDYARYIPFACYGKNGLQFIERAESFNNYQDKLISGQNIKTINGNSILGNGDIVINQDETVALNGESYEIRKIIPSYYLNYDMSDESSITSDANEYLDGKISSIPDGKKLIFFTDVHWYAYNWTGGDTGGTTQEAISTPLMLYCKKKLGISNVIFGGDVIEANMTQNKAKLEIRRFMNNVLSAFGSSMLFTMGNHDLNQYNQGSGYDWQSLLDFRDVQPLYYNHLKNIVYDNSLVSRAVELGYVGSMLAEIEAFSKTYYYFDDFVNKIRYIVVNTGASLANSPLRTLDNTDGTKLLQLEYKFVIDSLSTLPDGFDVVLSGHLIIYYGGSSPYTVQNYALVLMKILSDFKVKRRGSIQSYSSQSYEDLADVSNYDFSTHSDEIGKIIVLCGDTHHDSSCICQTNNGVYESVPYYDNVEQKDDCILVINTICEVCGGVGTSTGGNSTYYPTSDTDWGTVKETAFDIISWDSDSVTAIRVGNGVDRKFNY